MMRRAFFVTALAAPFVVAGLAQAETALRAPLSIVPAPMQAVLDRAQGKAVSQGNRAKLAPRVQARQMKRAVRAVAATPGSEGDVVQVGQLGALEDAPVGLEAGLGDAVWRGARLAFVADQMGRLPQNLALPGLYQLERSLHRGAGAAPIGTADNTSWFGARLMRLLALGDTQSVIELEAQTGAARNDGYVARSVALAHLGRGDRAAACAIERPKRGAKGRGDTLPFFMQMLVYCQLLSGEFEKASLTLELNEKTFGKDTLYRDMAYLMAAQAPLSFGTKEDVAAAKAKKEEPPLVLPDELSPMQIALLQLAGQALPDAVVNVPPYFMAAIAGDYAQAPLRQLQAAHLAVRFGASSERFSQTAQLADLSAFDGVLPSAVQTPDAVFLAQALRVIDASAPREQPHLLAQFLRQAIARGLWHDMIAVLDDRLASLPVPQAERPEIFYEDAPLENEFVVSQDEIFAEAETKIEAAPIDNPALEALTPPAPAPFEETPLPLADADRLILLLAHWQAGQRNAAENLIYLSPLDEGLARLARWQGFEVTGEASLAAPLDFETQIENTQTAFLTAENLPAISASDETLEESDLSLELVESLSELPAALQPDWLAFEARLSNAAPAEALYMRRQLAVYHALGVTLPETLLSDLVLLEEDATTARLNRLADNKWLGDLVLAQVAQFADKPVESFDAVDTRALLGSLRRAGAQEAAQILAGDMLLSYTAQLVAQAPHLFGASAAPSGPAPFRSQLFNGNDR